MLCIGDSIAVQNKVGLNMEMRLLNQKILQVLTRGFRGRRLHQIAPINFGFEWVRLPPLPVKK